VTPLRAALGLFAAMATAAHLHAQDASIADADRIRAALQKPPSKLTLQPRVADFTVHIEKRRPMQDIFDVPPWQLPPIGWQPPAWGTGINLMNLVSYVARSVSDAKRGRDERLAREDVQRAIADYCAGQEDRAAIQICSTSAAMR
jgi:hypothetical protein